MIGLTSLPAKLASAAVAVVLIGGAFTIQRANIKSLENELALKSAELNTCGGRLDAVLRDVRSDNEIDSIPDSDLGNVPDHWLRP